MVFEKLKKSQEFCQKEKQLGCEEEVKKHSFFQGFYLGDLLFLGHLSHTRVKEKKKS